MPLPPSWMMPGPEHTSAQQPAAPQAAGVMAGGTSAANAAIYQRAASTGAG